jgi:hypothetical protein
VPLVLAGVSTVPEGLDAEALDGIELVSDT